MNFDILGNSGADWLMALGVAVAVTLALDGLKVLLVRRLAVWAARTETFIDDIAVDALKATKWLAMITVGLFAGALLLSLPDGAVAFIRRATITVVLVQAGIWGDAAVRSWLRHSREQRHEDPDRLTSSGVIAFMLRLVLWAILVLMVLDNLGVNVSTLVASLGVGGIAVALAVQNILGDLFASLSIVLDKPFVVGDLIMVDTMVGYVEHIGLKTSRVRSLSGEQIVFSNNDLLKSRIQNLRRMETRRIVFRFGVSHRTPAAQLRELPQTLQDIMADMPLVRFDRAHLANLVPPALNFEVVYYVESADYRTYMDMQQEIYLRLLATLEQRGIALALPVQTVHLETGTQAVELAPAARQDGKAASRQAA